MFPYQLWYRVYDDAEIIEIIAVRNQPQGTAETAERGRRRAGAIRG